MKFWLQTAHDPLFYVLQFWERGNGSVGTEGIEGAAGGIGLLFVGVVWVVWDDGGVTEEDDGGVTKGVDWADGNRQPPVLSRVYPVIHWRQFCWFASIVIHPIMTLLHPPCPFVKYPEAQEIHWPFT